MWLTIDGLRRLRGYESRLLCRAVSEMLSDCVVAINGNLDTRAGIRNYGIDWFDHWEVEQRIWLLEKVSIALLTEQPALQPAAMWEATVDAVFQHVLESVMEEIDLIGATEIATLVEAVEAGSGQESWQQTVVGAFHQWRKSSDFVSGLDLGAQWRRLVMHVPDLILGVTAYHVLESYRDLDPTRLAVILSQKGLPADFLEQIPPMLSQAMTEKSVQDLQDLLGRANGDGLM